MSCSIVHLSTTLKLLGPNTARFIRSDRSLMVRANSYPRFWGLTAGGRRAAAYQYVTQHLVVGPLKGRLPLS